MFGDGDGIRRCVECVDALAQIDVDFYFFAL